VWYVCGASCVCDVCVEGEECGMEGVGVKRGRDSRGIKRYHSARMGQCATARYNVSVFNVLAALSASLSLFHSLSLSLSLTLSLTLKVPYC
jgi:hypothetical protein